MTTIYEDDDKVFLPHHNSKHQYYAHWYFDCGSIVKEKNLGMTSYTPSSEYVSRPFDSAWLEGSTRLDFWGYTDFWRRWSNECTKQMIKSKYSDVCDACYILYNYYKTLTK